MALYDFYGQLEPLVLTVPKSREKQSQEKNSDISPHRFSVIRRSISHIGDGKEDYLRTLVPSTVESMSYAPNDFYELKVRRFPSSVGSNSGTDDSSCSSQSCDSPIRDEIGMGLELEGSNSVEALALTVDNHVCPECGKRYSTSSNLARHRQTHRSEVDRKARKCPHCDKVYVSMPAYSMHVRTHSQGCQCPYCGKSFSRPWLLQGHIRTHTGEKPFKCPICIKAFADKSNLRAHIQTHSSSKPYICQRCGKAFALKSYLYKHEESSCMRMHHRHQPKISTPSSLSTLPPVLQMKA